MPKIIKTHRVNHSAQAMYDLVADVEKYPEFLPLCTGLQVRSRSLQAGKEIITADMDIGYKAFHETFLSRVTLEHDSYQILVEYLDGPISHLENLWKFEGVDEKSSIVHFSLEYEFKNLALRMLMGAMFDKAFQKFSKAFEMRADEIYRLS